MTERKFTDEEVIKALEHAMYSAKGEDGFKELHWEMLKDFLDLINRRDAEIKSLKKILRELKREAEMVYKQRDALKKQVDLKNAEIERLEELVDKLKSHSFKAIDEPVKEMTEGNNG